MLVGSVYKARRTLPSLERALSISFRDNRCITRPRLLVTITFLVDDFACGVKPGMTDGWNHMDLLS